MTFDKKRIFYYFDGKLTALEMKQVEGWCKDKVNEEMFYHWLDEWERSKLLYLPDDNRLQEIQIRLRSDLAKRETVDPLNPPPEGLRTLWYTQPIFRVAAMVVIVLAAYMFSDKLLYQSYVTQAGETRYIRLDDGSEVTLNGNSELRVSRFGYGRRDREVSLFGEALFSVVRDGSGRQFIVLTNNEAQVVVLGTVFSVLARFDSTHVKLNEGKVLFRYHDAENRVSEVDMRPGEQLTLDTSRELKIHELENEPEIPVWAIQEFRFDRTTLTEIIQLLRSRFALDVSLGDKGLGKLSVSGTYEVRRGEELLDTIAEVLGLEITHEKNKTILSLNK